MNTVRTYIFTTRLYMYKPLIPCFIYVVKTQKNIFAKFEDILKLFRKRKKIIIIFCLFLTTVFFRKLSVKFSFNFTTFLWHFVNLDEITCFMTTLEKIVFARKWLIRLPSWSMGCRTSFHSGTTVLHGDIWKLGDLRLLHRDTWKLWYLLDLLMSSNHHTTYRRWSQNQKGNFKEAENGSNCSQVYRGGGSMVAHLTAKP